MNVAHPHSDAWKARAQNAVKAAIKSGDLTVSMVCEVCGATENVCLHHWSYDREHWLDVIPLCRTDHRLVHEGTIPEPRTGRVYPGPATAGDFTPLSSVMRALRDQSGRTAQDVAADIGVSRIAVAHWEAGRRKPSNEALAAYLAAVGASPADARRAFIAAGVPADLLRG